MRIQPTQLKVYPNPWGIAPAALKKDKDGKNRVDPGSLAVDAQGRPSGATPCDFHEHNRNPGSFVGSKIDRKATRILRDPVRGELRSGRQDTVRCYLGVCANERDFAKKLAAQDPVVLPYTKYYVGCLKTSELLPADEATAKAVGLEFTKPEELLPALQSAARVAFSSNFETDEKDFDAFEFFAKRRDAAAEPAKKAEKADAKADADAKAKSDKGGNKSSGSGKS